MPKITRGKGATVAIPESVIQNVLAMHAAGDSLAAIQLHLNQWAVPRRDHDGVPRPGLWDTTAVQELIDANTEGE